MYSQQPVGDVRATEKDSRPGVYASQSTGPFYTPVREGSSKLSATSKGGRKNGKRRASSHNRKSQQKLKTQPDVEQDGPNDAESLEVPKRT